MLLQLESRGRFVAGVALIPINTRDRTQFVRPRGTRALIKRGEVIKVPFPRVSFLAAAIGMEVEDERERERSHSRA